MCATLQPGRVVQPPLTPIPVSGPFHRVGVDVIQFTKFHSGNRYAVVFVDYLTKWPEVFATPDQTALTIAKLFVEQIISCHGLFVEQIISHHEVPVQLLSDCGAAFLSYLLTEICKLMGVEKLNTTTYHPQTDGLAERFNRTLTDMLAKKVEQSGKDWDTHLPFLLLLIELVCKSQQKNHPLIYCMDATQSYPQL